MKIKKIPKIRNLDWLRSVWQIGAVNPVIEYYDVKNNKMKDEHIAPFPIELPLRIIHLYSKRGDIILDPFCGSGTTNYAALLLRRRTVGYDIEEKYIQIAKDRCGNNAHFFCKSSENMVELSDNSIDLCITSPPYLNLREYSDKKENIGNMPNPYPILKIIFHEIFRVLKPGGCFCLNVSCVPDKKSGFSTAFPFDVIYLCLEQGFKLRSSIIWDKGLTLKEWNIYNNEIMENHEYIWVFKK